MNQKQLQMLPLGTELQDGRYRIERYLASGGFGNTYEVVHTRLGKHMAMKEFFMRGINQREGTTVSVSMEDNRNTFYQMRDKFYKEAQRLASLEDLHIVEVSDFFEENQTAYYVMRLVDGESLAATMKATGHPFTEPEVLQILSQVLSALKTVHSQGIYHLDLKPGNIMRNAQGHCWLIDFGASKQMSVTESQTLSTSTGLCYTPGYAPSEQISGNIKRIGPWTDFYALGATIYNLLTLQQPPEVDDVRFDGEAAFSFPSHISAKMRQLVIWFMQSDYPKRPQRVEEIEEWLTFPASEETIVSVNTKMSAPTKVHTPHSTETVQHKPNIYDEDQKEIEKRGLHPVRIGGFFSWGGKWGYADMNDQVVIPCIWKDAGKFSEGLAPVQNDDGQCGYIDKTGNIVIPYQWIDAGDFSEGLAAVQDDNERCGFIDKTGQIVIPCQWSWANPFSNGLARVQNKKGKWLVIDKTGRII